MSIPVIRPATSGDAAVIYDLILGLADYEQLRDEVTGTPEQLDAALFGRDRQAEALVAELGDQPVGFALFFGTFSTFLCRPGIWLEDLFVVPEHRRKGVGLALFTRLAALAVERDCGRLEWSALNWNQPALRFYRSLGAQTMGEWQQLRLDGATLHAAAERS